MNIKKFLTFFLTFGTTFLFTYLYSNYDKVFEMNTEYIIKEETKLTNQEEVKENEENIAIVNEEKDIPQINNQEVEEKVTTEKLVESKKVTPKDEKKEEKISPQIPDKKVSNLELIKNDNGKIGTVGRLYIPSVNLSVAVYNASILNDDTYNAQEIVDNIDSAAYYKLDNHYVIADHNYQGFKKILNLKNNAKEKAYIKKKDGSIISYTMRSKFVGQNTKVDLVNEEGISVSNEAGDLIIYTCYGDNQVMITIWDIDN